MKAVHYVLTDAEHTTQLDQRTVTRIDPDTKRAITDTVPAVFEIISRDALTQQERDEAMVMAGLDKYIGGVAFGRLSEEWRGHPAGTFAIRHLNSSGYHVHVFPGIKAPGSAEPIAPELAKLQADEELARLEEQRRAQQEKDNPPPANDNKETPPAPPAKDPTPAA